METHFGQTDVPFSSLNLINLDLIRLLLEANIINVQGNEGLFSSIIRLILGPIGQS